jgi:large subunit ribosomal protein L4e
MAVVARPVISIFGQEDPKKALDSINTPAVFTSQIRHDLVNFVHANMSKNHRQAYGVKDFAGHAHSAESWGTGRAVSRIPRISGSGTHRAG